MIEKQKDHARIWLQNAEDGKRSGDGRMWCADKIWPDHPEDGEPTEYVRADLHATLEAEVEALREAGTALNDALVRYGYPVSDAALPALLSKGSQEAQELDRAARAFRAALARRAG